MKLWMQVLSSLCSMKMLDLLGDPLLAINGQSMKHRYKALDAGADPVQHEMLELLRDPLLAKNKGNKSIK